jgi:hypothetical protein
VGGCDGFFCWFSQIADGRTDLSSLCGLNREASEQLLLYGCDPVSICEVPVHMGQLLQ